MGKVLESLLHALAWLFGGADAIDALFEILDAEEGW